MITPTNRTLLESSMVTNAVVQTIKNAEIDARSLSEFIYSPANTMVSRRLAPEIHTLQHYIDYLNAIKNLVSQQSGYVDVNGLQVKTITQSVVDALNSAAIANNTQVDTLVTATPKFIGGVARTQAEKNKDTVSVKDFGAIGDGTLHKLSERYSTLAKAQVDYPHATSLDNSIDWAAIQAAIKTQSRVYIPRGEYCVNKTFNLVSGSYLSGAGMYTTRLTSFIDNNSPLFTSTDPIVHCEIADMRISTKEGFEQQSGHCFDFISYGGLSDEQAFYSPQHLLLYRIDVRGFAGVGRDSVNANSTMPACGFAQSSGAGTRLKEVLISDCKIGVKTYNTSTTRISNCNIVACHEQGVYSHLDLNCEIRGGNIIQNGGKSASYLAFAGTGSLPLDCNVLIHNSKATSFKDSRTKSVKNTADIILRDCSGVEVSNCAIRGGYSEGDDVFRGIYILNSRKTTVEGCVFYPLYINNSYKATTVYQAITIESDSLYYHNGVSILENSFELGTGNQVDYYVGTRGGSNSHKQYISNLIVEGNLFGSDNRVSVTPAPKIKRAIYIEGYRLTNSTIRNNVLFRSPITEVLCFMEVRWFYLVTKSTITGNHITYTSTIATNLATEGIPLYINTAADKTQTEVSLGADVTLPANGSHEMTVNVKDLNSSIPFSSDIALSKRIVGLNVDAWVSAANTVKILFENKSANPVVVPTTLQIYITLVRHDIYRFTENV